MIQALTTRTIARRVTRRGAALVTSLLIIVVLSAMAAGGFSMIESERKSLGDHEALADAYNLARSAFDRFLVNPGASLPAVTDPTWTGPDSVKFPFPNGYAYVMVQRLRPAVGGEQALYVLRSRAVRTSFRSGNTPAAERIFAQYARWETRDIPTLAAWTSLSGLLKNGGSGVISGVDACGKEPAVGGVAVPKVPGYIQNGGSSVPSGSPNILDMGPQTAANDMVSPIDWPGIVSGTTMVPDYVIPGSSWPSFSDPSIWPVIYVDQLLPWSLPGDGRGMLVVRNDMNIGGSIKWEGIVLVGGNLTSNGSNRVSGAVLTGLNVLLGQVVLPSDIGNGSKSFGFNSCYVASALSRFNGIRAMRNTTVDNWPSY